MCSKRLSEKGCDILYFFKLLPGFQHLSNFIQIQSKPVDRCVTGNGNMDMPVIHAGNGKFISIRQYELEDFLFLYRGYKALGGNSFIDRIKSEIDEWEVVS